MIANETINKCLVTKEMTEITLFISSANRGIEEGAAFFLQTRHAR